MERSLAPVCGSIKITCVFDCDTMFSTFPFTREGAECEFEWAWLCTPSHTATAAMFGSVGHFICDSDGWRDYADANVVGKFDNLTTRGQSF